LSILYTTAGAAGTRGGKEKDLWRDSDSDALSDEGRLLDVKVAQKKVTPEEFLGVNAKLVDFDDLVSRPTPASQYH